MSLLNDSELKNLLKKHQPHAPDAPENLLNTILYRMGLEKRQNNYRSTWILMASGLASCVLVFTLMDRQFASQFNSASNSIAPSVAMTAMLEEEDESESDLNSPSLNIGEAYLSLVSR